MGKNAFEQKYLQRVLSNFRISGKIAAVTPFGSGHIHDTFLAASETSGTDSYIIQRINRHVFPNVRALMSNFSIVTGHLREKLAAKSGADAQREALTLVPAVDGSAYYRDEDDHCFRVLIYLDNTVSYDQVANEKLAYQGGRGFSRFLALLADLDPHRLSEVIPGFHDIDYRLDQLDRAVEEDPLKRAGKVKKELDFVAGRIADMRKIKKMGQASLLPLKVTHNDTKFNNLLFDRQGRAQCVVDLDTVMPGYPAYDFGDALRSMANMAKEDERDLGLVQINLSYITQFARGFMAEAVASLKGKEVESLSEGCLLMPYLLGIRFLTDHIGGDHYFKAAFEGHNLQRARVQFRLVELFEEQFERITGIIAAAYREQDR